MFFSKSKQKLFIPECGILQYPPGSNNLIIDLLVEIRTIKGENNAYVYGTGIMMTGSFNFD